MPQQRDNFATWYNAAPGQENRDIAEQAYKTAVQKLETELNHLDKNSLSLATSSSIGDIQIVVQNAKEQYEQKPKRFRATRKCLEALSFRIMQYSRAFDTIASHHQEYVGLAWGAIKLVFMTIMNRADLVQKLSEALVALADVLPRTDLSAQLYPTEAMEAALSRLYVRVILFAVQCVRWYNRSSMGRLWKAFKDPFELYYKDLVDQVRAYSDNIDALATAGCRAETRDNTDLQKRQDARLIELDTKLEHVQRKFDNMDLHMTNFETRMDQLIHFATTNETIVKRISVDAQAINERTFRLEFNEVVKFFAPHPLPDTALRKATFLLQRSPLMTLPSLDVKRMQQLVDEWIVLEKSTLLVVQISPLAKLQARELVINLLSRVTVKCLPVFWSLSVDPDMYGFVEVLKSLIFQILHRMGELFNEYKEQLNLAKIRSPHSEIEWIDLLCLLLSRIPEAFIVVEFNVSQQARATFPKEPCQSLQLLHRVCESVTLAGSRLKMLAITSKAASTDSLSSKSCEVRTTSLRPATQVPPRLRHLAQRSQVHIRGGRNSSLRV